MPVKPTPILSKMNSKMKTFSANETPFSITTQDLEWNMKQMLAILAAVKKTEEVEDLVMNFMEKVSEIVPNVVEIVSDVVDAPNPEPPNLEPSTPEPSSPPAKNIEHTPGENVCPENMTENIDLAYKITSPEGQEYMTTLTEDPRGDDDLPIGLAKRDKRRSVASAEESVKKEETTITCVDFTKPSKDGIYQWSESLIDLNIIKKSLEEIPDSTTHLILNNAPVEVVEELVEKGFVETATKKLKVLEINLPKALHDVNLEEEWHSHHISTTLLEFCKGLNIDLTDGKVVYPLGDEPHEDGYPDDPFGQYVIWAINGSDYIATKGKIGSIEFPGHFCSGVMINNKMSYWKGVQEWENSVNDCLNNAIRRHGDDAISAETQFWDDRSFNYEEWGKDNYVIIRS